MTALASYVPMSAPGRAIAIAIGWPQKTPLVGRQQRAEIISAAAGITMSIAGLSQQCMRLGRPSLVLNERPRGNEEK